MASYYDVGDLAQITAEFTDSAGTYIDPTAVFCTYTNPAGTATTLTYGVDAALTRSSAGHYAVNISVTTAGTWYYRWYATGTGQASESSFFVVPAAGKGYTTTPDLKTYLDITADTDDALLDTLITRASALIEAYCRRTFAAASATSRYYDPTVDARGARLYLGTDLCAITTITNGDGTTVAAADYVTEPRNETPYYAITLKSTSGVAWTYDDESENSITVTGYWAYSRVPPPDIIQACTRTAAWLYKQRDGAFGQTARPEIGIIETPLMLPPDVVGLLKPYRRARVGAI